MLSFPAAIQVFLCTVPCDMRRSFDGLSMMAEHIVEKKSVETSESILLWTREPSVARIWRRAVAYWALYECPPRTPPCAKFAPRLLGSRQGEAAESALLRVSVSPAKRVVNLAHHRLWSRQSNGHPSSRSRATAPQRTFFSGIKGAQASAKSRVSRDCL
jgi:hypothetical protein